MPTPRKAAEKRVSFADLGRRASRRELGRRPQAAQPWLEANADAAPAASAPAPAVRKAPAAAPKAPAAVPTPPPEPEEDPAVAAAALVESKRLKAELDRKRRDDAAYRKLLAQRQKLPAYELGGAVVAAIRARRVVVVSADTGAGKTTQVPQMVLDDCVDRGVGARCSMVVTQPRRISAVGVAQRVGARRGNRAPTPSRQRDLSGRVPGPNAVEVGRVSGRRVGGGRVPARPKGFRFHRSRTSARSAWARRWATRYEARRSGPRGRGSCSARRACSCDGSSATATCRRSRTSSWTRFAAVSGGRPLGVASPSFKNMEARRSKPDERTPRTSSELRSVF